MNTKIKLALTALCLSAMVLMPAIAAGYGNTSPDGVPDGFKDASKLAGLLKLTVSPRDVTISTEDDSLVMIPAGVRLIHNFITATPIGPATAFDEPATLSRSLPPLKIDLAVPVGFGEVQLLDKEGDVIASAKVYGSTHASM